MTRRAAGLLGCLLAFYGIGAGEARAQDQTIIAPTTLDANVGFIQSPPLIAGRTYRLQVGGVFEVTRLNVTYADDAAYCFDDNAQAPFCEGSPRLSQDALFARLDNGGGMPFYQLAGAAPPFAASHQYTTRFVAPASQPLELFVNHQTFNGSYHGSLAIAMYLEPATAIPPDGDEGNTSEPDPPTALDARPQLGEQVSYAKPAAGTAVTAAGPVIPEEAREVTITAFTEDDASLVAVEPSEATSELAQAACWFTSIGVWEKAVHAVSLYAVFTRCLGAVTRVLNRCEALKAKRGGPGLCGGPTRRLATASAEPGCSSAAIRRRKRDKPALKARCEPTTNGFALTLRARRKGPKVRKALGKRPRLVIATAKGGGPVAPDDRIGIRWTAG